MEFIYISSYIVFFSLFLIRKNIRKLSINVTGENSGYNGWKYKKWHHMSFNAYESLYDN